MVFTCQEVHLGTKFPQTGRQATTLLGVYFLKRWLLGLHEQHSWKTKTARGLFSFEKDLHTFQRDETSICNKVF